MIQLALLRKKALLESPADQPPLSKFLADFINQPIVEGNPCPALAKFSEMEERLQDKNPQ